MKEQNPVDTLYGKLTGMQETLINKEQDQIQEEENGKEEEEEDSQSADHESDEHSSDGEEDEEGKPKKGSVSLRGMTKE